LKEESAEYTKPLERDWKMANLLLLDDLTQLANKQGNQPLEFDHNRRSVLIILAMKLLSGGRERCSIS
jgi:hypothetical protein